MCYLSEGYDSGGPSSKRTFNEAKTDHHEGLKRQNKWRTLYTSTIVSSSYVLQMLQWCVLAGFGVMHFLQMDTEGIWTLSWNKHKNKQKRTCKCLIGRSLNLFSAKHQWNNFNKSKTQGKNRVATYEIFLVPSQKYQGFTVSPCAVLQIIIRISVTMTSTKWKLMP